MSEKTECNSEIGITIGIIDSIINAAHLLKGRDLSAPEVKEAIKDLGSQKTLSDILIKSYEFGENFWKYPDRFVPIDEVGHHRIKNLYGRFAVLYLLKVLPIFYRACEILEAGNHFSEDTKFGEMHGDGYMWLEKSEEIKAIVFKEQSHSFLYIKDGASFYIRSLEFGNEEKHLKKFRNSKFLKSKQNPLFIYCDGRDKNHVFSCDMLIEERPVDNTDSKINETLCRLYDSIVTDSADYHTIHAIEQIGEWQYYLDNPDELT